ncbi:MAG: CvpA family protein [Ignavibacteria bacterium]|nr:CvpA family protein [Ignavibacteria bacterium]
MNWLDIVLVLLITLPTFFGYRKGFLRKLLGIAGIILGFILAVKFYVAVSGLIGKIVSENSAIVSVISFLLIVALIYGASIWLARFIANINSGTSLIDKILGTITGFLQGLLVASVLLYNLSIANIPSQITRDNSLLYPTVIKIAPAVFDKIIEFFPGLSELYKEYISPETKNDQTPKSK